MPLCLKAIYLRIPFVATQLVRRQRTENPMPRRFHGGSSPRPPVFSNVGRCLQLRPPRPALAVGNPPGDPPTSEKKMHVTIHSRSASMFKSRSPKINKARLASVPQIFFRILSLRSLWLLRPVFRIRVRPEQSSLHFGCKSFFFSVDTGAGVHAPLRRNGCVLTSMRPKSKIETGRSRTPAFARPPLVGKCALKVDAHNLRNVRHAGRPIAFVESSNNLQGAK